MTCINPDYTENPGVFVSVRPITNVITPVVTVSDWVYYEPVPLDELHITLAYNKAVKPTPVEVAKWLANSRIDENTSWRAAALPTVQAWHNDGNLYIGLEFYSPELFGLHESIKTSLGVETTFPIYKCHMTFGKFSGVPSEVGNDRAFIADFLQLFVGPANNNMVELSQLRFSNVK